MFFENLYNEIKTFAHECLLFQSPQLINRIYGMLTWGCFGLFFYAFFNLICI